MSYSVDTSGAAGKARGREIRMSKKHAVEISREIKGMPLKDAKKFLEEVKNKETPVPFKRHNRDVGHRSELDGWDAGRYPEKASTKILEVLKNAEVNAKNEGVIGELKIDHIAAHKVGEVEGRKPRAFGRATPWNSTLVDIEVVLKEITQEETE